MFEIFVDGEYLYYPDEEEFAIYNGKLKEQLSKASELTFDLPYQNIRYDSLVQRQSMIQVLRNEQEIFYGEVREIEESISKVKSVYCVSELAFLFDSIQPQKRFQNYTPEEMFKELIAEHNAQVEERKRFTVGIVTVTDPNNSIYRYTNYEDTLTAIREKLCDTLNGYLRIRKVDGIRYIDLVALEDYGVTASQPIQFGRNLMDYVSNSSSIDIATACIPLGAKLDSQTVEGLDAYVTIESVNDGKNYVFDQEAVDQFGWVKKVVKFDDVTLPENLIKRGEEWLKNNQFKVLSLDLKAVDLAELNVNIEPYNVGDMIQAIAEPFGMNTWFPLLEKTSYINESCKNDVTLSYTKKLSYTDQANSAATQLKNEIPQKSTILQSAKENASQLIKAAAEGNIFTVYDENGSPKELLIMDTNDINTAKKVWRWNMNGLGYSSTGYDGTYGLAMTIDGKIVADFVASGTMTANRIKGGELTLGGKDNTNGILRIINADGEQIGIWDKDGITTIGGHIQGSEINLGGEYGEGEINLYNSNGRLIFHMGTLYGMLVHMIQNIDEWGIELNSDEEIVLSASKEIKVSAGEEMKVSAQIVKLAALDEISERTSHPIAIGSNKIYIGTLTNYFEVGIADEQYIKSIRTGATNYSWQITNNGDCDFRNVISGVVTITPSAADTPTLLIVNWGYSMGEIPQVVATPYTSVPGTSVTGVGVMDRHQGGCTIYLTRKDVVSTNIGYIACANVKEA